MSKGVHDIFVFVIIFLGADGNKKKIIIGFFEDVVFLNNPWPRI
jgi:hypothetical protein